MPAAAAAFTPGLHEQFVAILAFLLFGATFVVLNMAVIGRLIRSKTKYTEGKAAPYECGEPTFSSGFVRFDIRFYVILLVFVIFDVEVLFLFPWAVVLTRLGPLAFIEAAAFVAVLALGLAYIWRKGDIDWTPLHGHQRPGARLETSDLVGSETPEPVVERKGEAGTAPVPGPAAGRTPAVATLSSGDA